MDADVGAQLLGLIQQATFDPRLWPDVLEELAERTNARGASMNLVVGFDPLHAMSITMVGYPDDLERRARYRDLSMTDPGVPMVAANPGRIITMPGDIPAAKVEASEIYRRFLVPEGAQNRAAAMLPFDDRLSAVMGVMRGAERGPFDLEELRPLELALPHLASALRAQVRLGATIAMTPLLRRGLNALKMGVAIVDGDGSLVYTNPVADRVLNREDGVRRVGPTLQAEIEGESAQLAAFLESGARASVAMSAPVEHGVAIARSRDERPLSLLGVPVRTDRLGLFPQRPAILVFFSDPDSTPQLRTSSLRLMYGLTPAEAQLAAAIAEGLTLAEHARQTGRSIETARSQLKSIFAKTATSRQSELVQLLLSSPAALVDLEQFMTDSPPER